MFMKKYQVTPVCRKVTSPAGLKNWEGTAPAVSVKPEVAGPNLLRHCSQRSGDRYSDKLCLGVGAAGAFSNMVVSVDIHFIQSKLR